MLVAALVATLIATSSGDKTISADGIASTAPSTAVIAASTTDGSAPSTAATTALTETPVTDSGSTLPAATTTTVGADATIPASTVAVEAAPTTVPTVKVTPPTTTAPAPGSNCTAVGSISIPATNVNQTILAEAKPYKDGLLCGNHTADRITPGVDILPGFAPFDESVAGGSALVGRVPAIIFGHRNSHNRPFLNNNKLKPGDSVTITNADGSTIALKVTTVELLPLAQATKELLAASTDGAPELRLVCCSHKDGSPGGVDYRWVVTLTKA